MSIGWQFKSVRSRLIFWFLVVALIPLLAVSALISKQRIAAIKMRESNKLTAIRELKVKQLEQWLEERVGDVLTISEDLEIRDLEQVIKPEPGDMPKDRVLDIVRTLMQRYLDHYSAYRELMIVHPQTGRVLVSTNRSAQGLDVSEEPYFQKPLGIGKLYIQDITYSRRFGEPSMAFAVPVLCRAHQRHTVGILVVWVDLRRSLYQLLLDRTGLGQSGETLLVNSQGMALSELRRRDYAPLQLQLDSEPVKLAARGETGIMEANDYRGSEVLAAYTSIPRTGWGFVAKEDLREIYGPIWDMFQDIALLLLVACILVVFLAIGLAQTIGRPIQEMARVARKFGAGDLEVRNPVRAEDDLGALARSFNTMAESVQAQLTIRNNAARLTRTMIAAKRLQQFQSTLLEKLMEVTDAHLGVLYHFNQDSNHFEAAASLGVQAEALAPFAAEGFEGQLGRVLKDRTLVYLSPLPDDSTFLFKTFVGDVQPRELVAFPLLVKDRVEAVVCLAALNGFAETSLALLQDLGFVMNMGLANQTAAEETRQLAQSLKNRNQELQAQSEELQAQSEELRQQSTELQEQNQELESQKMQVESADRMKSEFLSNMSHELRTPLNSVMALARVLKLQSESKLTPEESEYLEIIQRNGQNLLDLINDILDLSKIEAGRMELNPKWFDLIPLIEAICERLEPLAAEKGIVLHRELPELGLEIQNDEGRLHQILQNLIGNAVKFTEQGGVTVSLCMEERELEITVQDTGIGIEPDQLPFIFDEFRQVDGSSSRKYDGTGLGLAIASRTTRMLGGSLTADSRPGQGSVFTLKLPVHFREKTKDGEAGEQHLAAARSEGSRSILVVEDNAAARIQVRSILEQEGYAVFVVQGGQEALDFLQTTHPDGMVLDLMMPDVDGFGVLQAIRSDTSTAHIPVLVLTAKDLTRDELSRLESNHIQQLIQKGDVDKDELIRAVAAMLRTGAPVRREDPTDSAAVQPQGRAEGAPPEGDAEKPLSSENAEVNRASSSAGRKPGRILVVEDNPDNMTTIRAILKNRYALVEAENGEDGLSLARAEAPDLILLDMALPGMDGLEVLAALKTDPATARIPVIAMTAQAMKGDRERFLEAGCADYLAKPIDPAKVIETIRRWILDA